MRGASKDIQAAIDSVIEGLGYNIDIDQTDDDKIKGAMESKVTAFTIAKDLIHKWRVSKNAPSEKVLKQYIKTLSDEGERATYNLREALAKKIDYESLDSSKIKGAIQSKPIIYKALFDIEAGVFELRKQLESGNINVEDQEFQIGFPEKFAAGEMLNISTYFKNWYNDRENAVKICPFGTEGEIITIEDLKIQLPKPPRDPEDILFIDLPKEEQYWRRQEIPLGLTRETQNEYAEWIHNEFKRRVEGVWFMNNGKPTYLTGDMYFALQYCRMLDDGSFMKFRKPQADLFYFMQACIVDTRCLGDLFEKSRRTGFTYIALFIILNRITMTKNQKAGITSKTDKDAEEAFMKLSYAFLNLPFFFRPVVRGNQESTKRIEFAKPIELNKEAKKKSNLNIEKYLNTVVDYRPSTDSAYDSIQLNWYLCDEAGKRANPQNIIKHMGQVTPTMKKGGRIVGKMFVGSTVGDRKKGGENFKELAEGSNVKDRNDKTGQTTTGLYRHALYAHENHEKHIDVYGICHITKPEKLTYNVEKEPILTGSMEYIKAEADQARKQNEDLYNEYLRANPLSRGDMYRYKSTQNQFNQNKLTEQFIYNKELTRNYVMRGNFSWHNGEYDTTVDWVPDPHGKFYVTWLQTPEKRNKMAKIDGIYYPMNGQMGRGGVDSFDIAQTVDGKASNGAFHLYNMYSMEDNIPKNQFVLEYIERPPYPEIFYEDVLMAAVFYGYPLLIERNKEEIIRYFKSRGYQGFVMKRPKEFTPESNLKRKVVEYGIPSNSTEIIMQHASKIERYIHYHVGVWTQENEDEEKKYGRSGYRQVGSCGSMLFERTLTDWSTFDINDRTKYDATISSGFALMAASVPFRSFEYIEENSRERGQRTNSLARRYEYVNGVPRRI